MSSTNKKCKTKVKMRDRISGLPDSPLLHILSFLPTKEAVATSLLSKRWRSLWHSLPALDFNRRKFKSLPFFHQFVGKVLKLVDLKSVKKFVLRCDHYKPREYFRPRMISKWINAVVSNKVEHLELRLDSQKGFYELPSIVFTANYIKVLKCRGVTSGFWLSNGVTLGTLSHVNLPSLEVLYLENVKFPDFRSLGMVLSACALLKELVLKISDVGDCPTLDIGGLNHLVSAEVPQTLLPLKVISNVTFLRLFQPQDSEQVKWPFNEDIPMFHNLIHLECHAEEWTRMVNCLENFPKLEKLVIYELCSTSPPQPILDVPSCVSLHLKEFTLLNFEGSESALEMVEFIIKHAGVLRTVSICHSSREYKLPRFEKLAENLKSGSGKHEQPLVFMIS
ncbi:F-box/LRR-repeat protein 13-like [Neltuma alba]|uniref:F-box/LRR-repeat protein 13-like n=1 Tax=Neltuma alba TaxID=207710 RepID=UPI0010A33AE0|nr:F-box/LRR-repeat protein 13-like [Prosopis alba]